MTTPKRKLESGDPDVTALATRRDAEIAAPSQSNALMQIIDRAANDPAFDVAKLQELLKVKKEYEADEARKAFNEAFTAFKGEAIVVVRNKTISAGPLTGKKHAELFAVVLAVTPLLSKHGLSHHWKTTKDEPDWIEVTCTIKHVLGHSESVSMGGPPDSGGAKNAIQARASTTTYLQRYTLKSICGVAEQGEDNDGAGAKPQPVTDDQVREVEAKFGDVGLADADLPRFLQFLGVAALADMNTQHHAKAMLYLNQLARAGSRKK